MKHPDFDGEYLTSARLILTLMLGMGCVVSFGAELFSLPWSVVSRTMFLAIVVALVFVVGRMLCGWRPQVGRWFTLLGLSLLVHTYGLWLEIPGALGWAIIPTAYAACLVSVSAAALMALVESVWVLLLAQFLGVEGALAAVVAVWALFFAIAALSYQTREQTKWYAGYFEQAQRLLADVLDHRAELVQALDDLSHANRQLALMNRRVIALQSIAEEAQAAKTRFVARVSHEFRTPLNMIIGLTDLLIEKPENYDAVLSPRMRDALRVVHRNSQHLSDMVNDVLDLSRIETDHVVLRRERVPIRAIIQVAVEAVRPLIENKRLKMHLDIPESLPDLYCDRTRIEQVVLNLLSNAVRYTDHGSIAIEASQQTHHLCVRVTDTGQGILPQDRERIFEPFAQGTSTVWRNKGGTGLGLSISKQFIELHDGRIWV
jgi:signal transduction histidine kinase